MMGRFFRRPPSCDHADARFNDVAAVRAWAGQSHPKREPDKKKFWLTNETTNLAN
jgi:hypothetical protein